MLIVWNFLDSVDMYYSLSEIFAIGIGPSSSHTVGPMKAAKRFVDNLGNKISNVADVKIYLYGSLALTGIGHGTLNAVIYGLLGYEADKLDLTRNYIENIKNNRQLLLRGKQLISFDIRKTDIFERTSQRDEIYCQRYQWKHYLGGNLLFSRRRNNCPQR